MITRLANIRVDNDDGEYCIVMACVGSPVPNIIIIRVQSDNYTYSERNTNFWQTKTVGHIATLSMIGD
jgi:hypothetical protein